MQYFRGHMGSLALRPGDSLAIHEMALSIGFRIFSFLPSCYSSYGALNFYPGGTFTHCSCQPSLDAHFSFPIRRNFWLADHLLGTERGHEMPSNALDRQSAMFTASQMQ